MKTQNIPTPVMNAKILEAIDNDNIKAAQDSATDYTRTGIREDSFAFKVLPPELAPELDRGLDETQLQVIWELEPESPGAKWVPLQTVPDGEYIMGSRYVIPFARVVTPKFMKDIDELRTTRQDIRKILTDNSIKDGLAEIDSKFIATCDAIVQDTADSSPGIQRVTGKTQWQQYSAPLNRETFAEASKMLTKGNANGQFRMRNHIALMNESTSRDWLKLKRDDVGGDLAQTFFTDGLTIDKFMGLKSIFTIKDNLVPDNTVYFFAAPEFLGKCFYLTDWTMHMKKVAWFIEMFSYWLGGFAFGNIAGVCRADFGVTESIDIGGSTGPTGTATGPTGTGTGTATGTSASG